MKATLKEIVEKYISLNIDNDAYEAYKGFFAYEAKELGYTHIEYSDTHVIAFELDTDNPRYRGRNVIVVNGEKDDCPHEIYEISSYEGNGYINIGMTREEKIKEICLQESNEGFSEKEYRIHDKYNTNLSWAWEEWEDEFTMPFWESEKKPDRPTQSFREDYFLNEDFEEYYNEEEEEEL